MFLKRCYALLSRADVSRYEEEKRCHFPLQVTKWSKWVKSRKKIWR